MNKTKYYTVGYEPNYTQIFSGNSINFAFGLQTYPVGSASGISSATIALPTEFDEDFYKETKPKKSPLKDLLEDLL